MITGVNILLLLDGDKTMSFAERYVYAVNTSDLRDDEHHSATHALTAAALADVSGGEVLGSLLARTKYADGVTRKTFEAGTKNMAQLLHVWRAVVHVKGRERRWLPMNSEWEVSAAMKLCDQVAEISLAHWLGGECPVCLGAKVTKDRRICNPCGGSGKTEIQGGRLVVERAKDMVSELEGLFQAHSGRAQSKLRAA